MTRKLLKGERKMKWKVLTLFLALSFVLTACSPLNALFSTDNEDAQITQWEDEIFNRFYNTDGEQADNVVERIATSLDNKDSAALIHLFSARTVGSCENIDKDISQLFDFYDGEMVEYKRYGPGSSGSKDNGQYTKEIFATYDVTTTAGVYRIAIEFCTIHSLEPDKIGLTSLYIIKAEDSDMDFAYWGNEAWGAGIVIDEGKETEISLP